jgi:branched-chain amino acid transport system ATP-binding protein
MQVSMIRSKILFNIAELRKYFGGLCAVNDVSFQLAKNQILGLIGPNGSGKTTLVNLISGILKPNSGSITLNGIELTHLSPWEIAKKGIGRTFQIPRIFNRMTVFQNLLVPGCAIDPGKSSKDLIKQALELLDLLKLSHLKDVHTKKLSGGQKKLVEIGRVCMLNPSIVILDEAFAGVHPQLAKQIQSFIRQQHLNGRAFIIISHDLNTIFSLSERIIVLNAGKIICDGKPEEVRRNESVRQAYLGDI